MNINYIKYIYFVADVIRNLPDIPMSGYAVKYIVHPIDVQYLQWIPSAEKLSAVKTAKQRNHSRCYFATDTKYEEDTS